MKLFYLDTFHYITHVHGSTILGGGRQTAPRQNLGHVMWWFHAPHGFIIMFEPRLIPNDPLHYKEQRSTYSLALCLTSFSTNAIKYLGQQRRVYSLALIDWSLPGTEHYETDSITHRTQSPSNRHRHTGVQSINIAIPDIMVQGHNDARA